MTEKKLAMGIMGTGNIAWQFSAGVRNSRRCRLVAVGSRQMGTARELAVAQGIATAYGSYEELLADKEVDAIYVSLPNSLHKEWTIKALRAGKHVLCEKPLAMNAPESEEMFTMARKEGRTLVEGFMYRAHPLTEAVASAVRRGAIGQVRLIRTSFCFRLRKTEGNVRFKRELGGGALLDVGCYCINYARLMAGAEPVKVTAVAQMHENDVDELVAGTMLFDKGIVASFTVGMCAQADNTAYVCGSEGYIETPVPWKPPAKNAVYTLAKGIPPRMDLAAGTTAAISPTQAPRQTVSVDAGIDYFALEADALAATVLDGQKPMVSPDDTIGNMRVLDEMSRQIH